MGRERVGADQGGHLGARALASHHADLGRGLGRRGAPVVGGRRVRACAEQSEAFRLRQRLKLGASRWS